MAAIQTLCRCLSSQPFRYSHFFLIFFSLKGLFFLSHARELACEGEMKCLSNVILTRFYVDVRKCDIGCKGSVDLNEN